MPEKSKVCVEFIPLQDACSVDGLAGILLTLLPVSIGGVSTCMLGTKRALCACGRGLMAVACGMIVCACKYPCVTVKVPVF